MLFYTLKENEYYTVNLPDGHDQLDEDDSTEPVILTYKLR